VSDEAASSKQVILIAMNSHLADPVASSSILHVHMVVYGRLVSQSFTATWNLRTKQNFTRGMG